MKIRKIHWIYGEEKPNSDSIKTSIEYIYKDMGLYHIFSKKEFRAVRMAADEYRIEGILCEEFADIRYKIVKGETSFPDSIHFFQVEKPTSKDIPTYICEDTKNGFDESGNMTDQRSEKFALAKATWPTAKCVYVVNTKPDGKQEPYNCHKRAMKRMRTNGHKSIVSSFDKDGYTLLEVGSYKTVQELVNEDQRLTTIDTGDIHLDIPLWKSKNPKTTSDPNVGVTCSVVETLNTLGFKGTLWIKNHYLDIGMFDGKNKLSRILRHFVDDNFQIHIEGYGYIKSEKYTGENYFGFIEDTNEKVASIALENIFENLDDWEIIFDNHAGCSKGYFYTGNEHIAVPKQTPKIGEKKPVDLGLPDLVVINYKLKKILIIEGESKNNIEKGYEQIKQQKFKDFCSWVSRSYRGYEIECHLCVYGTLKDKDKIKYKDKIFYSLDSENNEVINWDATPVWALEG